MSRRKQARPIRVLESEEGVINLPSVMDLTNGGGSEAESVSGSSISDSEDEEAHNKSKVLSNHLDEEENHLRLKSTNVVTAAVAPSMDAVYERLKTSGSLNMYPHLLEGAAKNLNKHVVPDLLTNTTTIKSEYDDCNETGCEEEENLRGISPHDNILTEDDELQPEEDIDTKSMATSTDTLLFIKSKSRDENDDNNNSNNNPDTYSSREMEECELPTSTAAASHVQSLSYNLPASHVTLTALQNTQVAVAQFAATALANSENNPAALQGLAILQTSLQQLQQQQLMQIGLIQQLQHQLQIRASGTRSSSPVANALPEPENVAPDATNVPIPLSLVTRPPQSTTPPMLPRVLTPPKPSRTPTPVKREPNSASPPTSQPLHASQVKTSTSTSPMPSIGGGGAVAAAAAAGNMAGNSASTGNLSHQMTTSASLPPCSISSPLALSIITNLDPPPSPSEPNTLDLLKKRTQEVLDNASQGLLANNLADELGYRRNGVGGRGSGAQSPKNGSRIEPFYKHRCRFCGKVFGSDSALQIHIRSHTGERPFKCNVCGSRFTTKGNLKVHFQRHTVKFPHIKMNPNPVPEHLDKLHPSILPQVNNHPIGTPPLGAPGSHPTYPTIPQTSASPFNPYLHGGAASRGVAPELSLHLPSRLSGESMLKPLVPPFQFFGNMSQLQDQPENLMCKPSLTSNHSNSSNTPSENGDRDVFKKELMDDEEMQDMSESSEPRTEEADQDAGSDGETREDQSNDLELTARSRSRSPYGECSVDSKYSNEDQDSEMLSQESSMHREMLQHHQLNQHQLHQDQPENLSNKSRSNHSNDLTLDSRKCVSHQFLGSSPSPASSASDDSFVERLALATAAAAAVSVTTGGVASLPANINNSLGALSGTDSNATRDPFLYSNLLPRPGSTDNSWENLIEIKRSTSETCKLQALVDNIGHKLSDPNECVVCHRVLSCKSALQMHYRTHTGERPFRCRICGRSFTTKGNLKTHMGVHRIKPPVRVHHQCPVCHKRFTNSLILQQHIRLHTGEPTDLTPEQIQASEIKEYFIGQSGLPVSRIGVSNLGVGDEENRSDDEEGILLGSEMDEEKGERDKEEKETETLADLEKHVKTATTMSSHMAMVVMGVQSFSKAAAHQSQLADESLRVSFESEDMVNERSPASRKLLDSPASSPRESGRSVSPLLSANEEDDEEDRKDLNLSESKRTSTPLDLTSAGSPSVTPTSTVAFHALGPDSGGGGSSGGSVFGFGCGAVASTTSSNVNSSSTSPLISSVLTTSFNPLGLAVASSVRGNTTCNICYKTFACNSALEIHYRSHTKERPFKCTVCDRGFSTKGNMKQHMLTHKIRDMPSHLFEKSPGSVSVPSSLVDETSNTSTESRDTLPNSAASLRCVPMDTLSNSSLHMNKTTTTMTTTTPISVVPTTVSENVVTPPLKRSPENDTNLPVPKRQPSLPKHLCHVCNKNFSSSSALQIHMRTHTGDKPFRCNVCMKAFTTKGNLKVHMGTHMWTNGASRRGRRMSLELPSMPISSKDAQPDIFHRRPDLFYPYLPAPFFNGVHSKLSEISSLQSVGANLSNGFFPFASYGTLSDLKRPSSPMSPSSIVRHIESDSHSSPSPWDLHFERKAVDERVERSSTPSPPHQSQHQAHGEGLAA